MTATLTPKDTDLKHQNKRTHIQKTPLNDQELPPDQKTTKTVAALGHQLIPNQITSTSMRSCKERLNRLSNRSMKESVEEWFLFCIRLLEGKSFSEEKVCYFSALRLIFNLLEVSVVTSIEKIGHYHLISKLLQEVDSIDESDPKHQKRKKHALACASRLFSRINDPNYEIHLPLSIAPEVFISEYLQIAHTTDTIESQNLQEAFLQLSSAQYKKLQKEWPNLQQSPSLYKKLQGIQSNDEQLSTLYEQFVNTFETFLKTYFSEKIPSPSPSGQC